MVGDDDVESEGVVTPIIILRLLSGVFIANLIAETILLDADWRIGCGEDGSALGVLVGSLGLERKSFTFLVT